MVPNLEVVLPPSLGHQQDVVVSGVARTTNCVEAWHFGHQASFIGAPPFIRGKMDSSQKNASIQKLNISTHGVATSSRRIKKPRFKWKSPKHYVCLRRQN